MCLFLDRTSCRHQNKCLSTKQLKQLKICVCLATRTAETSVKEPFVVKKSDFSWVGTYLLSDGSKSFQINGLFLTINFNMELCLHVLLVVFLTFSSRFTSGLSWKVSLASRTRAELKQLSQVINVFINKTTGTDSKCTACSKIYFLSEGWALRRQALKDTALSFTGRPAAARHDGK